MFMPVDPRRERFDRVFPGRVNDVREGVRRIGNCLSPNYVCEKDEFLAGLEEIQKELDFVRSKALGPRRRA